MALLIRGILEHNPELLFTVDTYHVSMRRDKKESICEATVRVARRRRGAPHRRRRRRPGERAGRRLALALVKSFPQLKKVSLTDYKVRILDTATGTAAKTRVLITSTDGKREWGTVGVSENIIEAACKRWWTRWSTRC